jgi:hypothetical protein
VVKDRLVSARTPANASADFRIGLSPRDGHTLNITCIKRRIAANVSVLLLAYAAFVDPSVISTSGVGCAS